MTQPPGEQSTERCTCILGNDPLVVTTSVMDCEEHRGSDIGQTERRAVDTAEKRVQSKLDRARNQACRGT